MVLNLTRPTTSATLPRVPMQRDSVKKEYDAGHDAGNAKFGGMSREELNNEFKRIRRSLRENEGKKTSATVQLERMDRLLATLNDLELWAKDFLVFEKPAGGAAAELRQAFRRKEVQSVHELLRDMPVQSFEEVFEDAEIFRVEHDWLKAIRKANEFDNGSFRLPYETSVFEFQVSRKPVVAMCLNYGSDTAENEIVMQLAVESFFGWALSHNIYRHNGGRWEVTQGGVSIKEDKLEHLVELIGNQIRAACIALDAEVAATTLVREGHEGKARDAKEYPAYEFYTINIARRGRAEALQAHGATNGTKRLHFRRGHWRHFTASKTWVRWCLVGNPELGFIDKQYRL